MSTKNKIKATNRSVVNIGEVIGSINTGSGDNGHPKENARTQNIYIAAIITAIGAMISGLLIAASNFFK